MSASSAQGITLGDGTVEVDILPHLGAAITRCEFMDEEGRAPIFMPTSFGSGSDAMAAASILLVPWSNRISGGGFPFHGRFVSLSPNLPGEAFPIHGNAFQLPWELAESSERAARLCLESYGPGEFRYSAQVEYEIIEGMLGIRLGVKNTGSKDMLFGLGLHPWLPRTPETQLEFEAKAMWREDKDHLPSDRIDIADRTAWDFSCARRLPDGWINNAFENWDGRATIIWPEQRLAVRIAASANLGTCIVYSPGKDANFFCFEPVSHPVDAHNLPVPEEHGLVMLAPGELLQAWCLFVPERIAWS